MKRTKGISRRDLLKSAGAAAAVGTLGGSEVWSAPQASAARSGSGPRVLALIGDRYHNSDYIRVSLDRLFSELSIQADYTTNYDKLSRSLLEPYQIFLGFRDSMIWHSRLDVSCTMHLRAWVYGRLLLVKD